MRSYLTIPVGTLVLAGLLVTGGCVPKAEYDKAMDLNRKAQEQIEAQSAKIRGLEVDKTSLAGEIAQAHARVKKAGDDVALLEKARTDLQADYDTLMDLYRKTREPTPPPPVGLVLPVEVDKALRAFAKANPDLVEYRSKYGMVKLKSDFTFALGSTTVKAAAGEALTKLVAIINDPAVAEFHIYIAGHTDNVPITRAETRRRHPTNWYLSVHRAVAVQKVMIGAGLAEERIGVMGFGEFHPVAPNKTSSTGKKLGNQANRRVEIWIVPPNRFLTSDESAGK